MIPERDPEIEGGCIWRDFTDVTKLTQCNEEHAIDDNDVPLEPEIFSVPVTLAGEGGN